MNYLTKGTYDAAFQASVRTARLVTVAELQAMAAEPKPDVSASLGHGLAGGPARLFPDGACLKVQYTGLGEHGPLRGSQKAFIGVAKKLGLMADVKANVPRTTYQGVLSF